MLILGDGGHWQAGEPVISHESVSFVLRDAPPGAVESRREPIRVVISAEELRKWFGAVWTAKGQRNTAEAVRFPAGRVEG